MERKLFRVFWLGMLILLHSKSSFSQIDTSEAKMMNKLGKSKNVSSDSAQTKIQEKPQSQSKFASTPDKKLHSPAKAGLYSAILPGLGQAYNKKYWKIGIIGAGTAALVYSYQFSSKNYRLHKDELILRQSGEPGNFNPDLTLYSDSDLNELQDFYRRNRDLTVIGFALLYALNIVDATVDAHFFDFNMSDDLSLNIRPEPVYNAFTARNSFGLGINLRF